VQTAGELAVPQQREGGPTARDRLVQHRFGLEYAVTAPRRITYETYFLPLDFEDSGLANRISRATMTGNMLAAASIDGMIPAQALAAGGEPGREALALSGVRNKRAELWGPVELNSARRFLPCGQRCPQASGPHAASR